MSDLIPCRFCRFAPHAWLDDYINGRAVTDPEYIIECENGNCSVMPEVRGTYPYMDEVRAMWNAANALPAAQPDPREAALRDIARQKKTDEMDTEYDVEYADFEGGYNAIIDVARVALRAVHTGKEVMPDATRKVCDHDTAPASTDDAGGGAEKMALCDAIRKGMGLLRVTHVDPDQRREDREERAMLAREDDQ